MPLHLYDVYRGLGGAAGTPRPTPPIQRFVIDSREVEPGDCFIALKGERTDGHRFIGQALEQGARAALASHPPSGLHARYLDPRRDSPPKADDAPVIFLVDDTLVALQRLAAFWRRRHHPTVIGVTGSVGKTSTKELLAAVLRQRHPTLWNKGNLNNEIGLPLSLLRLEPEHRFAVLEMGFYVEGEIRQLCHIAQPHVGIITNIGPIHLERAGSMEAIYRGKAELVQALPSQGRAILNWDDEWVRKMADISPAPVFRYGLTPEADLWADEIVSRGLEGVRFRFHHRQPNGAVEVLHVHLPLLGRHSVHTALRAAAGGLVCGLAWEDIIRGLRDVNAQLRIEVAAGLNGSTIIDDTYNASPPSTIAALNLLADMEGRRIAVLGDMLELGSYAETGHRLVGRRAADVVDALITVGSLSRWIREEAIAGGLRSERAFHANTAEEAIERLEQEIGPGDFVLVKGSRALGMEAIVLALSVPKR
ncbi:MAG: UDP-N-acetylmuramoyl-tripeptide--D-alanyl-D-alanine ligase [Chloroflexi bacterium]|nr:UDP-N-acetylmuramoyl-tripeptide--D-alanyl-D-alanine ligase [Chloroflexota bacterium]